MTVVMLSIHAEGRDKVQWSPLADDVSLSEYRNTCRHNQRVLRSAVRSYSRSAAQSMGLPKKATQFAEVTAGIATSLLTNQDLKFRLNDKKTFALEVKDPSDNDRALFLNYKLKW